MNVAVLQQRQDWCHSRQASWDCKGSTPGVLSSKEIQRIVHCQVDPQETLLYNQTTAQCSAQRPCQEEVGKSTPWPLG